ncbi:ABC transporter [Streptomyces sp. NPDC088794]|uniref:ABC transporter n=1 Tax=Streptomyces sp. NPDC088794 TaxID=3365902 RepID=UPI00382CB965
MRGLIRELTLPVWRSLPWRALLASGAMALLLAAIPRMSDEPSAWLAVNLLRTAALVLALGLAFVLDDPARHTTAAVPVRRPVRAGLRLALVAPVLASWWTAALLLVPSSVRPPVGDITLEAGAAFALALAGATAAIRFTDQAEPGQAVAAGLLVLAILTPLLLPESWALFVAVGDKRWAAAHERWAVLLTGAAVVWGLCMPERIKHRSASPVLQ